LEFEWDENKEEINDKNSFHEAATVFGDPLAITFDDPDHSIAEHRLLTFGVSRFGRLLLVSHTEVSNKMRLISPVQ